MARTLPAAPTSMRIPYVDLSAQHAAIRDELMDAIGAIIDKNAFVLGPGVDAFERRFAEFCGAEHCVAVNTGTAALHLALLAYGVGSGDEVITQADTFIATVAAIMYTGARPVLVDVTAPSYTIDVRAVEAAITPRTKAILPVHLFGQPCDLDAIRAIAKRHGLALIEDALQLTALYTKALRSAQVEQRHLVFTRGRISAHAARAEGLSPTTLQSPINCGCSATTVAARNIGTTFSVTTFG